MRALFRVLAGAGLALLFVATLGQSQTASFVVGGVLGNLSDTRVSLFGQPVLTIVGMAGQNRNTLLTWADKTENTVGPPSAMIFGGQMLAPGYYNASGYGEGWLSASHGLTEVLELDTGSACEPTLGLPPVRGPDSQIAGCITVAGTIAATTDATHTHDSLLGWECSSNGAKFAGACFYVDAGALRPGAFGFSAPNLNLQPVSVSDLPPCQPSYAGTIQGVSNAWHNQPNKLLPLSQTGPYHDAVYCTGRDWLVLAGSL